VLGIPTAVARFNYRLARLPFQLIDDVVMAQLAEASPLRLAYERVMISCDVAAARLLHDSSAAARAATLRQQTAPARLHAARVQIQADRERRTVDTVVAEQLHQHRERFLERHQAHMNGRH
jgi:hypothetical protein